MQPATKAVLVAATAMAASALLFAGLMYVLRYQMLAALRATADYVGSRGVGGALLYAMLLMTTCFPPIIGYSVLLTLSGFIYGVGVGFVLNYCAALCGATLCFLLSRWCFNSGGGVVAGSGCTTSLSVRCMRLSWARRYVRLLDSVSRYLHRNPAHKLRFLLALRLAPYPFTLLNVVLAHVSSVSLPLFVYVTALSLVKVAFHAWVGSSLTDLAQVLGMTVTADSSSPHSSTARTVELVMLGVALVVAVVGGYYLYTVVQKALMASDADSDETLDSGELAARNSLDGDGDMGGGGGDERLHDMHGIALDTMAMEEVPLASDNDLDGVSTAAPKRASR